MEDKKSLKDKLKAHLPHKRGAEEKQKKGAEDTGFTIRLARFIIESVPGSSRCSLQAVFSAQLPCCL